MRSNYCVYAHCRLSDNKVFYIGKGSAKRAKSATGRSLYWKRVAEKHGFYSVVLFENLTNEQACEKEIELISEFGRDYLCNLTDGGEGTPGRVCSEKTKKLMSDKFKGIAPEKGTIDAAIKITSKPVGTTCGLRFKSISDAARWLRLNGFPKASKSAVFTTLSGKSNKSYGYEFRYVDENNLLIENGYVDQTNKRKRQVTNSEIVFQSVADAAKFVIDSGLSQAKDITTVTGNIVSSCRGRGKTLRAYGFMWSYV